MEENKELAQTPKVPSIKPISVGSTQPSRGAAFVNGAKTVLVDVVKPALGSFIRDLAIEMIDSSFGRSRQSRRGMHRDYSSYSRPYRSEVTAPVSFRDARSVDRIVLESRAEAEELLDYLDGFIREFGFVTVADLNASIGISSTHIDHEKGWTSIGNASVRRDPNGYEVVLPQVVYVK